MNHLQGKMLWALLFQSETFGARHSAELAYGENLPSTIVDFRSAQKAIDFLTIFRDSIDPNPGEEKETKCPTH